MTPDSVAHVGRLAPSPTGLLHLGHARTFLLAWWLARRDAGRLLIRFDDLDAERSSAEFADAALRDLEWLGLDWDGSPTFQSHRQERFDAAATSLEARGLAYACTCSRGDIRNVLSAPHAGEAVDYYPGTCRERYASRRQARELTGKPAGLRFRSPSGLVTFTDALMGPCAQDVAAVAGDFLIVRRDGVAAYQLAVVVDDAADGVTHVVRGCDLLDSTPRQIALQQALGLPALRYVHAPLVQDASGRRLAKRADDVSLSQLRAQGVRPERIVGWAAHSLGLSLCEEIRASDVVPHVELPRLTHEPTRVLDRQIAAWQRN